MCKRLAIATKALIECVFAGPNVLLQKAQTIAKEIGVFLKSAQVRNPS